MSEGEGRGGTEGEALEWEEVEEEGSEGELEEEEELPSSFKHMLWSPREKWKKWRNMADKNTREARSEAVCLLLRGTGGEEGCSGG